MTIAPEQHRAEAHAAHLDADRDNADREESLRMARQLAARYAGTDDILLHLDQADLGDCDQCHRPAHARWQLGRYTLCRHCATSRITARRHADTPLPGDDRRSYRLPPRIPARAPEPHDDEVIGVA